MATTPQYLASNLISGIREGDKAAFEIFYRMERNNLVHFVASYVKDSAVAEDLAQEALLKIWENRSSLDPQKNIRAYVYTIARNSTLNYLKTYRPYASIEECEALSDHSLDDLIETLDLQRLVEKTYLSLPPKVRNTFLRSRLGGLKNKEIAKEEGVSEKAIEYRIGNALKKLRKIIE